MMRYDPEKKMIPFQGSSCAIVTPFKKGEVDFESLGVLIDRQIDGGTSAIVVCGTTGEAPSLSDEEYRKVVEYTVHCAAYRIPVIAGTGGASTGHVCELTRIAAESGADAVLAVTPYYVKASEEGLFRHYSKISSEGLPVIVYNVPSRTGMSITMPMYERLSQIPGIVGVKEASGNMQTAIELSAGFSDRFALYSGSDELNLPLLSIGFDGFISVTANIDPVRVAQMYDLWKSGDMAGALSLHRELYPLTVELFSEVNPIPVKKKLEEMGLCTGELRLPLY